MCNFYLIQCLLRAGVLGRMGGLSPSKSVCSILPIARDYLRAGVPMLRPFPRPALNGNEKGGWMIHAPGS
jgi:hypothetical protein